VQSKSISQRKAGKEGTKNDAVADSFLRAIVAIRHKERLDFNQKAAVQELVSKYIRVLS
jgi:hypothetical protein